MKKVTVILAMTLFAFVADSTAQSKPAETIINRTDKSKGTPLFKPVVGAKVVQGSGVSQQSKRDSVRRIDIIGQFPKKLE
ncbi:MAG: hypothetical protein ABIN74_08550 [Ferruginibacter sp.]